MKRLIWFRLFLVSVYICNNKPHSSNNLGSFLSSFLLYLTIPNIATYNILTVCFPKFQVLVLAVQFENLWVQWSFGEVVIWNTYPIAYLNFYLYFFMIFFFFFNDLNFLKQIVIFLKLYRRVSTYLLSTYVRLW